MSWTSQVYTFYYDGFYLSILLNNVHNKWSGAHYFGSSFRIEVDYVL